MMHAFCDREKTTNLGVLLQALDLDDDGPARRTRRRSLEGEDKGMHADLSIDVETMVPFTS